jgi:hypothetical protein
MVVSLSIKHRLINLCFQLYTRINTCIWRDECHVESLMGGSALQREGGPQLTNFVFSADHNLHVRLNRHGLILLRWGLFFIELQPVVDCCHLGCQSRRWRSRWRRRWTIGWSPADLQSNDRPPIPIPCSFLSSEGRYFSFFLLCKHISVYLLLCSDRGEGPRSYALLAFGEARC